MPRTDVVLRERLNAVVAQIRDVADSVAALRDRLELPVDERRERPAPGDTRHMSPEYLLYLDHVDARLKLEFATRGDTWDRWYSDPRSSAQRSTDVERRILRKVRRHIADLPVAVDRSPQLVVVLGPAGVGKSKLVESGELDQYLGFNVGGAAVIDHDWAKRALRKANLCEPVRDLTPAEHSPLLHRESMHLANHVAQIAIERRVDVVCDFGCPATPDDIRNLTDFARRRGYELNVVEVRAELDVAASRAMHRHRSKMRVGEQRSGRFVHPSDIADQAAAPLDRNADGAPAHTKLEVLAAEFAPHATQHVVFRREASFVCLGSPQRASELAGVGATAMALLAEGESIGL